MRFVHFAALCAILAVPAQASAAFKMSKPEPKKAAPAPPPPVMQKKVKTYKRTRHYRPTVAPLMLNGCPADLICASNPVSVLEAVRASGNIAILVPTATSNPIISSSTGAFPWEIHFEGCTNGTQCDVLEFVVSFGATGSKTAWLTNQWNNDSQFGRASATKTTFEIGLSVSTVGGLNKTNFADVMARWSSVLGDVNDFFTENPAKKFGVKLKPDAKK